MEGVFAIETRCNFYKNGALTTNYENSIMSTLLQNMLSSLEQPSKTYNAVTQERNGEITFWDIPNRDFTALQNAISKRQQIGGELIDYVADGERYVAHRTYMNYSSEASSVAKDWETILITK